MTGHESVLSSAAFSICGSLYSRGRPFSGIRARSSASDRPVLGRP
jgi:hypothetical protein